MESITDRNCNIGVGRPSLQERDGRKLSPGRIGCLDPFGGPWAVMNGTSAY